MSIWEIKKYLNKNRNNCFNIILDIFYIYDIYKSAVRRQKLQ